MNKTKTIFITLAVFAAGTSATRADELSDLVAAVAASTQKEKMAKDVAPSFIGADKPRYKPQPKTEDVNIAMLDGIFSSMKRESFRQMQRDLYNVDDNPFLQQPDSYDYPPFGSAGFYRPVPGVITSRFGWRERFNRMHYGVDLNLNLGDTVRAALTGTVDRISFDPDGYGHYVVMSHPDGMETRYAHLQYALVSAGEIIYAGQPVGIGGSTGNSTGPHLHFETRLEGVAVDPTLLFDFEGNNTYYAYDPGPQTPKGPTYSHQSKSLKKESTYIVRYGDTPESVARQAGLSVMKLCQLNMLNQTDPLPIGRMLKLK